jgi:hypothetical protein
MDKNTLLYVLSTLAQTCAALAAFVGAAGIYRLQVLEQMRRDRYDDIFDWFPDAIHHRVDLISNAREVAAKHPTLVELIKRYDAVEPARKISIRALFIFELCQLVVILFSLIGFAFLNALENSWYTYIGLFLLAFVAVGSTGYCVLAWFREKEG